MFTHVTHKAKKSCYKNLQLSVYMTQCVSEVVPKDREIQTPVFKSQIVLWSFCFSLSAQTDRAIGLLQMYLKWSVKKNILEKLTTICVLLSTPHGVGTLSSFLPIGVNPSLQKSPYRAMQEPH